MVVDMVVNNRSAAETPVMTFDNGIATVNVETCEALGFDLAQISEVFAPLCTALDEVVTAENFE
jgi:putative ABC transport system substrate-binding protein